MEEQSPFWYQASSTMASIATSSFELSMFSKNTWQVVSFFFPPPVQNDLIAARATSLSPPLAVARTKS